MSNHKQMMHLGLKVYSDFRLLRGSSFTGTLFIDSVSDCLIHLPRSASVVVVHPTGI